MFLEISAFAQLYNLISTRSSPLTLKVVIPSSLQQCFLSVFHGDFFVRS